jgi:tRNA uridine 5-carboxymethylaminomethyl modification enzyme
MYASVAGLEHADIMRYGYAIEYDCIDTLDVLPTLEFKKVEGIYTAGQINGTSGYEEAAAQGLIAGMNATLYVKGKSPVMLTRDSSYIGTLIDDLVTKGTNEPYRMMTSRSEYRLLLRQDNADARLSKIGHDAGLLSDEAYERYLKKEQMIATEKERLFKIILPPSEKVNNFLQERGEVPIKTGIRMSDLLRRPEITYDSLAPLDPGRPELPDAVTFTVQTEIKYEGYIKKQLADAQRFTKLEKRLLPQDIDYRTITGLSTEAVQKLNLHKPYSIGAASRISGVSPADISVLLIYLDLKNRRKNEDNEA